MLLDHVTRIARGGLAALAALAVLWAVARVVVRDVLGDEGAGGEVVLTVMHWSGDAGQEEDRIVEEALRGYERDHPGVRVRRINPGDAGSFYTKLQTMMAAGTPPETLPATGPPRDNSPSGSGRHHPASKSKKPNRG